MRMYRRPLLAICLLVSFLAAFSQAVDTETQRTYDGAFNNPVNPEWGAAGQNLIRFSGNGYSDLISAPAGPNRPNPRVVSNTLFAQSGLVNDPLNLSDFCWVFGQFLDHDFGITPDGNEFFGIPVPSGDAHFDPLGTGQVVIPMMRNLFDPASGTDPDNPRRHPNLISTFIDGSGVYGSDEERADYLRSFTGGKLRVSQGNLMPFNTTTGEFDDPIDPDAPHMDNPVGLTDKFFVAGDVRANENPLLAAFHTIFVREHNRLCDELAVKYPDWTDEQLYQHARKLVGGIIQAIVYEEWLPVLGVQLPPYDGYKDDVNPALMNVFTAAAFRLGHTLLNSQLRRVKNDGEIHPEGHVLLRDAFFNPLMLLEENGVDMFLKGMATQTQQKLDPKVIDDVRNFLFGPPGAGGLDLASININRGRERGLPDFNTIRESFGLPKYQFFQQINANAEIFTKLLSLYVDINTIDPWVGFLSEMPMPGALFGETLVAVMERQFQALRDGDRFYYLNDPVLSDTEKNWIKKTTFHKVIMRNSGITLMQDEVFRAMPHSEICDHMTVEVDGNVVTETGQPVSNVVIFLDAADASQNLTTGLDGVFAFQDIPACQVEELTFSKNDDFGNGVSTLDLIIVQKHILGIQPLNSPYKIIAADVDHSQSVSTLDLIHIRKVVLGVEESFPNNTSWRFVPADYEFLDPTHPLEENFPESVTFGGLLSSDMDQSFIAIKVGDVNLSADPNNLINSEVEERNAFAVQSVDMDLQAGQTYEVAFTADRLETLQGYQFGLTYDQSALRFVEVKGGVLPGLSEDNFGIFAGDGAITTSWNTAGHEVVLEKGTELFRLVFEALQPARLSSLIALNANRTAPLAFGGDLSPMKVTLAFTDAPFAGTGFEVSQNRPNPFVEHTIIPFYLPEASEVTLRIVDVSGKTLMTRTSQFDQGNNEWQVRRNSIPASGILYYQVSGPAGTATRKMVLAE
jgi:hypothetical protein